MERYKTFHGKIEKGQKGVLVINPDKLPSGTLEGLIENTYKLVGVATDKDFKGKAAGVYDCYCENGQPMMVLRVPPVTVVTPPQYFFPQLRSACQNGRCPK